MRYSFVSYSMLGAGFLVPSLAFGQVRAPTVARLTPYAGYVSFGSFATGPLGSRLTAHGAPLAGVLVGLDVAPNVALVGNVAYASSDLEVGMPFVGGYRIADAGALFYDGGVQIRLGGSTARGAGMVPFVEAGVGAVHYDIRRDQLSTTSTNFNTVVGGGVDVRLGRALGFRLFARDHIGRFDFREAAGLNYAGNLANNLVYGLGVNLGF